mgnify:CR=1 FL=1
MLFSEPKIPQLRALTLKENKKSRRFSALQRAENSSIVQRCSVNSSAARVSVLFSEPKIPQFQPRVVRAVNAVRFSALQRAENSSIIIQMPIPAQFHCFSALQRAENSSI